jgi:hypothetical protein
MESSPVEFEKERKKACTTSSFSEETVILYCYKLRRQIEFVSRVSSLSS